MEALGEVGKNAASKAKERLSRRSRVQEDFNASDSGEEQDARADDPAAHQPAATSKRSP